MTAGTAQAATPGTIKVCNIPTNYIWVHFPNRGGAVLGSPPLTTGHPNCHTTTMKGTQNERIDVYTSNGRSEKYLGSAVINLTRGAEVHLIPGPSFYAF